jgi:hypothetical protein
LEAHTAEHRLPPVALDNAGGRDERRRHRSDCCTE